MRGLAAYLKENAIVRWQLSSVQSTARAKKVREQRVPYASPDQDWRLDCFLIVGLGQIIPHHP